MEDTGDKIRRNLVVFSALILIAAWLRVPLSALAEKTLGGVHADNTRAWIVVVAVHVYLMFRYRFASETIHAANALFAEQAMLRSSRINRILSDESERFVKTGRATYALGNALPKIFPERLSRIGLQGGFADQFIWTCTSMGHPAGWAGTAIVNTKTPDGNNQMQEIVPYSIAGWRKATIAVSTWSLTLFYSHSSTELLVPVVLGTSALAIAAAKVVGWL